MPTFTNNLVLACTPADVFAFLRAPANRLQLTSPEWPLELLDGPPVLEVGSRTTWRLRRYGVSQTLVFEVTASEPPSRLVEEQREGPFRRWVHAITCEPHAQGVSLQDAIDYEPPSGMLGLLLTEAQVEEMLAQSFAWRDRQLRMKLEQGQR
jgi:ligand-binding SRPBCC domain-containing protein